MAISNIFGLSSSTLFGYFYPFHFSVCHLLVYTLIELGLFAFLCFENGERKMERASLRVPVEGVERPAGKWGSGLSSWKTRKALACGSVQLQAEPQTSWTHDGRVDTHRLRLLIVVTGLSSAFFT